MPHSTEAAGRLAHVLDRIKAACARSGRNPAEVTLVAVSKTHPALAVKHMFQAGQAVFGESYVQEALPKMQELAGLEASWHFIGRLQKNKAKYVAGSFELIHTVDSLDLARMLHKKSAELGRVQKVLLQVNLAGEAQKAGCTASDVFALAEAMEGLDALRLEGLMLMPPWDEDGEKSRPWFAGLKAMQEKLCAHLGRNVAELSMGMSHDLEQAVEEGATLVRVGTDLFGHREA